MTSTSEYLKFALSLRKIAHDSILPYYQKCQVDKKSDGTVVTEADRLAEQNIRKEIERVYPDHAILGEEYGEKKTVSEYKWILDPIDGTASFTLGLPNFGTLIALLKDNEPYLGVIYLPILEETVYAETGGGCWLEGRSNSHQQLHVSRVKPIEKSILSATGVHSTDIHAKEKEIPYALSKVINAAERFNFWGDCLHYTLLCKGMLQGAIDPVMAPWDIAALIPCVEEAGGKVTSIAGKRDDIVNSGSLVATCGEPLHAEIINLLEPN